MIEDHEYFARRVEAEREAAERAAVAPAREAHRELAERYAKLAENSAQMDERLGG